MVKADSVDFKQAKKKQIKKEDKELSARDKLKEKMKKLNSNVRNQLQEQIRIMNKPSTSFKKWNDFLYILTNMFLKNNR